MRFVARDANKAPACLTQKKRTSGKTETEEAIEHYDKWSQLNERSRKAFEYKVYGHKEVKEALMEMFENKCAYCEERLSSQPPEVEHWRPKGAVFNEKTKKLMDKGYYWLGACWDNLFPACIDCNRARNHKNYLTGKETKLGKANRFPLEDENKRARKPGEEHNEKPLLLNPCMDKPEEYLEFSKVGCVICPRCDETGKEYEESKVSIEVYALNRPILVEARKEKLGHIDGDIVNIYEITEELEAVHDPDEKQRLHNNIHAKMARLERYTGPKYEFTLMVKQRIERFKTGEYPDFEN